MDKKQAHFEAFGYQPLRMKPAHFASGFFISLTDEVYGNELLNKVAVIKSNKGLQRGYSPDAIMDRLRSDSLITDTMAQAEVELLRVQVNGVVNNDDAMYPAFRPYRPKGNDYTFISPRVLTDANRTDGYAGHFVATVLAATDTGKAVLDFASSVADEPPGTLERFVNPLLAGESKSSGLAENYEINFGELEASRVAQIAEQMQVQSQALLRLCENLVAYSHYRRIRYLILGLLAWLMSYLLRTAAVHAIEPVLLFDFVGRRDGPIRSQSQTCYSRLRETIGNAYRDMADAGRFSVDPIENRVFARTGRQDEDDFRFLEQHFGDLALRMGYAQPRASSVPQKHFEFQPDTLRALMLSILDHNAQSAITFEELCDRLGETWSIVIGGSNSDAEKLRQRGYFGFDETHLQHNAAEFAARLESLNLAVEPSDGLILCSRDIGEVL